MRTNDKEHTALVRDAAYDLLLIGWDTKDVAKALGLRHMAVAGYKAHITMREQKQHAPLKLGDEVYYIEHGDYPREFWQGKIVAMPTNPEGAWDERSCTVERTVAAVAEGKGHNKSDMVTHVGEPFYAEPDHLARV